MTHGFRALGVLIVVCGVAVFYGAFQLWPEGNAFSLVGAARVIGAAIAAVMGIVNIVAGLAVLFFRPSRQ